ncbi:MAG: ABC transporter substrate-binding protein [Fusobacteriaceae bacterium]
MKKIFWLLIITLLLVGGCGKKEAKLEFYTDKGEIQEVANKIFSEMKGAGFPEAKFVGYTQVEPYRTAIQQSIDSEKAPGLFTWWSGMQMKPMVENKLVVDLGDEWDKYYIPAGVNPGLKSAFSIDGKVYAAPMNVLYNGVFYNKKVFDKYGLKIPTTLKEFTYLCDILVKNGVTPIGIKNEPWASFLWAQTLIASFNPELYSGLVEGKIKYTDPKIIEVMNFWIEMTKKGYFSKQPEDPMTYGGKFIKGDYAMVYEPEYNSQYYQKNFDAKPEIDFSMFVFPSKDSKIPSTIFFEAAPIMISAKSAQSEKAIEFLRGYYKAEYQQPLFEKHGFITTDSIKITDPTFINFNNEVANPKYVMKLRFYESEKENIVSLANDQWWKIYYNPTKEQVIESMKIIQDAKDEK